MVKTLRAAYVAALLIPLPGSAAEVAFDFQAHTLDNGLNVITVEDFSCPIVAVQVFYHVGSKDEDPERQGFAHMFEHMMFRGTELTSSTEHFDLIQGVGGMNNAYTIFDQTVYINEVPADQLDLVLWLEAERMAKLKIDGEGFSTERKVVEEERRMGLNRPYGAVLEQALAAVFEVHPYRWSPIGQIDHLRAATLQELQDFWDTYYVPNNATLVITGAVSHEDALASAQALFSWIPRGAEPPRVTVEEPAPAGPKTLKIKEERGPLKAVGILYETAPLGDPDAIPLKLLGLILGGGESSRLHRRMVNDEHLAVAAVAGDFALEQAGLFGVGAVARPLKGKKRLMRILQEEVARLSEEPVSEEELLKAKNAARREQVEAMRGVMGVAQALGSAANLQGDAQRANEMLALVDAVTPEDLMRAARTWLTPQRATQGYILPTLSAKLSALGGGGEGDGAQADEDLTDTVAQAAIPGEPKASAVRPETYPKAPPVAEAHPTLTVAPHEVRALANGMKVVVIPDHELPFVTVQLITAGSAFDEVPGTAAVAFSSLSAGTAGHDRDALAEELETWAIQIGSDLEPDLGTVELTAVSDQLERGFKLFGEMILSPTFEEEETADRLQRARSGERINERSAEVIAGRVLDGAIYGDHPYARPSGGTQESLGEIDPAMAAAWWGAHVRPDTSTLFFAGDVTPVEAFALAEATFGAWAAEGDAPRLDPAAPPAPTPTHILLVDRPGSVQSQIRVGHLGAEFLSPDVAELLVLSEVFGGSFGSRLNASVRVEKGLTYGAGGRFDGELLAGRFVASTFSKTATTAEAVQAVIDEIRRLVDEPPTAEEVERAKAYFLGSFAGKNERPSDWIGEIWQAQVRGLPTDAVEDLLAAIAATTPEAVAAAAKARVHPDDLVVVVVGDASKVKADLEKIAEVTVVAQ